MIHYAKLDSSPRLQRLMTFLGDMQEHTTREIVDVSNICAVNTAICELRRNLNPYGIDILCRCLGRGLYAYKMVNLGRTA